MPWHDAAHSTPDQTSVGGELGRPNGRPQADLKVGLYEDDLTIGLYEDDLTAGLYERQPLPTM